MGVGAIIGDRGNDGGVGAINGGRGNDGGGTASWAPTLQLCVKVPGSRTYGEGGEKWGGNKWGGGQ